MPSAPINLVACFDKGAVAYRDSLRTPLGRLRTELTWIDLCQYLPHRPLDILDVGGGPGDMAVRLVRAGHRVTLLDPSKAMHGLAREHALSVLAAHERPRLRMAVATLEEMRAQYPAVQFDVVLCHDTIEYLRDEANLWRAMSDFTVDAGLFSVLVPNREAVPIQLAKRGLIEKAKDSLAAARAEPDLIFGIQRRSYDGTMLRERFEQSGITPRSLFGVRATADFMPEAMLESDFPGTVQLELALGASDPYRRIARFLHAVGEKRSDDLAQTRIRTEPRAQLSESQVDGDITTILPRS